MPDKGIRSSACSLSFFPLLNIQKKNSKRYE